MTSGPLVSIIIATYNRERYVNAAIESALAQTYRPIEIIVVDDGSTDGTSDTLGEYMDRINYIRQDNQGEACARNTGIDHSTGEFIAILDSDDVWLPDKLEIQIALMCDQPEISMVATQAVPIDTEGNWLTTTASFPHQGRGPVRLETILLDSPLVASTLVIRRNCLPKPLPFTPGLRYVDWEMCLRVASYGTVWFEPVILALVRIHGQNDTYPLAGPEQIERRLAHRFDILGRVWPELPLEPEQGSVLLRQFEAREMAETAIPTYVNGDPDLAAWRLNRALELDPDTWQRNDTLEELVLHYATLIFHLSGEMAVLEFLQRMMANFPTSYPRPERLRRRILASVHVFIVATSHGERRERAQARTHILKGLRYNPTLLANRGVLSRLARTFSPFNSR